MTNNNFIIYFTFYLHLDSVLLVFRLKISVYSDSVIFLTRFTWILFEFINDSVLVQQARLFQFHSVHEIVFF
jgi:hypothetical protein